MFFEAGIVSTDLTARKSSHMVTKEKAMLYKRKSDVLDNLKRLVTEQLKPKKIEMKRLHSDNAKKLIGIKKLPQRNREL